MFFSSICFTFLFSVFEESRVSSHFLQDSKQKSFLSNSKKIRRQKRKTTKSIWIIKSQIIECFKEKRQKTEKLTIFHLFCLFKMLSYLLLFSICLLMAHKANKIWDKIIKIRINGFLFHYFPKTISTPNFMEIGDFFYRFLRIYMCRKE